MRKIVSFVAVFMLALSALALGKGAYYGTNYTVPFAHAYRALQTLGVDHREAIDRDIHHFELLGLDAFRLHLWDVELTDSVGNMIDNEHLDVLNYLLSRLEEKGIAIVLTAQTNFGNGYPERNTDPYGAFSYRYPKCEVHSNHDAVEAQERYLRALVNTYNPYTGLTYGADPSIIAMEINNEPCHSGTTEEIAAYVDRMASALRQSGWDKPILYNVSHNLDNTIAFYRPEIDGVTFQWYPTGLVHGSRVEGNFLPFIDNYNIPWDTLPGYEGKSKVVYEFDPGDVLETYLYPACVRSFRKAGFEWATQFAYDPIDMARFNTEYQTHFLNLAYTPGKAIGMAIAAEAMRRIPLGRDYGKYPADTIFGENREFLVSARRDLAMLNDGTKYYHTNHTEEAPLDLPNLRSVKGVNSSPIVNTDGTGAYFLDKIEQGVWRLELMPDVYLTSDPFRRPSLKRTVADILDEPVNITVALSDLPADFYFAGRTSGRASENTATLMPGTYLLSAAELTDSAWIAEKRGTFVMPHVESKGTKVIHAPGPHVTAGINLIEATVLSDSPIDSVVIYPSNVDFWRDDNVLIPMRRTGKHAYQADIEARADSVAYNIVVFTADGAKTFPGAVEGAPLDWDYTGAPFYRSAVGDIVDEISDRLRAARVPEDRSIVLTVVSADGFSYETTLSASQTADYSFDAAAFEPVPTKMWYQYPMFMDPCFDPDSWPELRREDIRSYSLGR